MSTTTLAKNLQFLRKKHNISQSVLADALKLTRNNIASYENGKAEPKVTPLLELANFFDIELRRLIEQDLTTLSKEEFNQAKNSAIVAFEFSTADKKSIQRFVEQSADLNKILEGFREFYKFKMQVLKNMSGDLQNLSHDFENLLSVMERMQVFNDEVVEFITTSSESKNVN